MIPGSAVIVSTTFNLVSTQSLGLVTLIVQVNVSPRPTLGLSVFFDMLDAALDPAFRNRRGVLHVADRGRRPPVVPPATSSRVTRTTSTAAAAKVAGLDRLAVVGAADHAGRSADAHLEPAVRCRGSRPAAPNKSWVDRILFSSPGLEDPQQRGVRRDVARPVEDLADLAVGDGPQDPLAGELERELVAASPRTA